jgi:hypothetical protein
VFRRATGRQQAGRDGLGCCARRSAGGRFRRSQSGLPDRSLHPDGSGRRARPPGRPRPAHRRSHARCRLRAGDREDPSRLEREPSQLPGRRQGRRRGRGRRDHGSRADARGAIPAARRLGRHRRNRGRGSRAGGRQWRSPVPARGRRTPRHLRLRSADDRPRRADQTVAVQRTPGWVPGHLRGGAPGHLPALRRVGGGALGTKRGGGPGPECRGLRIRRAAPRSYGRIGDTTRRARANAPARVPALACRLLGSLRAAPAGRIVADYAAAGGRVRAAIAARSPVRAAR